MLGTYLTHTFSLPHKQNVAVVVSVVLGTLMLVVLSLILALLYKFRSQIKSYVLHIQLRGRSQKDVEETAMDQVKYKDYSCTGRRGYDDDRLIMVMKRIPNSFKV